jgi:integrase
MPKPINSNKFQDILNKYKANGLTKVSEFLDSIAMRSERSALAYSFALEHFNRFVQHRYSSSSSSNGSTKEKYNAQIILEPLKRQEIDVYALLNNYISYLRNDTINGHDLSAQSIKLYVSALRSYLAFYDIELTNTKFKNKIKMPRIYHEDEEAIDANDIRDILNHCNNRRLKAYLFVLASGGMRSVEALAIRLRDFDFSTNPTQVRIRKEYAKTGRERRIFISDEATKYVKQWINWKYRDRNAEHKYLKNRIRNDDDLVFAISNTNNPRGLYFKVLVEFQKVLEAANLTSRKEDGVYKRRKVTFHSFRRFVKTTIANQSSSDFSEWFLGHNMSSYYTNKSDELRRIYKENCMKYLTFLDYPTLEATGRSYEAKFKEKDREIVELNRQIAELKSKYDSLEKQYIDDIRYGTNIAKQTTQKAKQATQQTRQIIPYLYTLKESLESLRDISANLKNVEWQMTDKQKFEYLLNSMIKSFSKAAEAEVLPTNGTSTTTEDQDNG